MVSTDYMHARYIKCASKKLMVVSSDFRKGTYNVCILLNAMLKSYWPAVQGT